MLKVNESPASSGKNHALADVWDAEYVSGKYINDQPLAFVYKIIKDLNEKPNIRNSYGLYVGCGNGRNYITLSKNNLNIVGLDVSKVGLEQIAAKEPHLSKRLVCNDFLEYFPGDRSLMHRCVDGHMNETFGYIIAIQSFQHGDMSTVNKYFHKARDLLNQCGILFVRINASDTVIEHTHEVIEKSGNGFTVLYTEGPKKGLPIRFFSKQGLKNSMCDAGFKLVREPEKITIPRNDKQNSWSQWEAVATPSL